MAKRFEKHCLPITVLVISYYGELAVTEVKYMSCVMGK